MPTIERPSLTEVWQLALAVAASSPNREVHNLVITATAPFHEDASVTDALDNALEAEGLQKSRTVAGTIFPYSLWRPSSPRSELYGRYLRIWNLLRKHPKNRRGTYFQRLINYPTVGPNAFNQLEQIITTFLAGNHRRSALQGSITVPSIDLTDARQQGFPCMQQIAFIPHGQELEVVAYYPMQFLVERAYGNYLGLYHLGLFMAQEMKLTLKAVTCISVIGKLDRPSISNQIPKYHEEPDHVAK